jgi:hypothetical protein
MESQITLLPVSLKEVIMILVPARLRFSASRSLWMISFGDVRYRVQVPASATV